MDPVTLMLLGSFGAPLLGKLFGGQSPEQRAMEEIRKLYDPAYRAKLQGQYYQQNLGSPAYAQAQGTIAAGGNQAANVMAQNIGETGLRSAGVGSVMSAMVPSMVGHNLAGLRTGAYNAAGSAADTSIEGLVQSILKTMGPSMGQQMGAAGMDAFSKFLQAYLQNKYPGTGTKAA
jgi:hypothetical protein